MKPAEPHKLAAGERRETILTEVSVEGVAAAFVDACWRVNMRPTHDLIIIMLAHSALETGHWKVMRNYNFGNVKATGGWIVGGGDFCFYEASENFNPKLAASLLAARHRRTGAEGWDVEKRAERKDGRWAMWFFPSHIQARFRSFATLADGASAYIAKLLGRYADAIGWAQAGNVERYVATLHQFGYFTAGLAGYTRLVRILFKRYWKTPIDLSDPAERIGNAIHGVRSGVWVSGDD